MKVAHINHSYGQLGGSGTEQSVPNTCALLAEHGVQTCVLYERQTGPSVDAPDRGTYLIPGLCSYSVWPRPAITARALAVLDAESVDLVHLHQINNGHLVRAVAARWPTFYFVHNHILTCPSGTRFFRRSARLCPQSGPAISCLANAYREHCHSRRPARILGSLLDCLDARSFARGLTLGVDSEYMKDTLVASGYPADRIVVTPTVTEITPPPADDYPMSDPPSVLYVGQLSDVKGPSLLIEAFSRLTVPARLGIAGEGYLLPALQRQVGRLGLADRVAFLGHVSRDRLATLLRESAVLAVPARYPEPLGLVGPEAMAHARPVVAFAVGGIPEWLEVGVTGLLARPSDVDDLAAKIEYVLTHPIEARQMGLAGRRTWEERFHPRWHVAALLRIYEGCGSAQSSGELYAEAGR
jgi:glycosyltransferase involved in cell wall biosynthesis